MQEVNGQLGTDCTVGLLPRNRFGLRPVSGRATTERLGEPSAASQGVKIVVGRAGLALQLNDKIKPLREIQKHRLSSQNANVMRQGKDRTAQRPSELR